MAKRRRPLAPWLALLVLLPLIAAAAVGWRLLGAIGDAQRQAVVPLPTPGAVPAGATPAPPALYTLSGADIARELVRAGLAQGDPGADPVWKGRTSLTVLVLGLDRQAGAATERVESDVVILARLDLAAKTVRGVLLPADLLVEIPGAGTGPLSSAYGTGARARPDDPVAGVVAVRDTLVASFGVAIDSYVLVDFAGFQRVVDAVGGVEIDIPAPLADDAYPLPGGGSRPIAFAAGRQTLSGAQALAYIRLRPDGAEDNRRERQTRVLLALFAEGQNIGTLPRTGRVIAALGDAVQTSFLFPEQLALARIALAVDRSAFALVGLDPSLVRFENRDGTPVLTGDLEAIGRAIREAL
ncbi:MAG: hypothetical protein AVDCRST_MAG73-3237 [uncultured Thermomicrobiales bacterium]|uniref:Cell envelope-related transcriptional attenuator domain-containing protein n=1 Tax=uncultured Thermomicrobiales bacterium TaxID=1645740 RepID=A0A6J4UQJ4_9BACT|nr:MAG: hypothetical protein AVDCRST_MAG73-3237 [uncultured Thermomicrobiales bacterium]